MAVTVIQFNNGAQSGDEVTVPAPRGESDADLLAWKLQTHVDKGGWSLMSQTATSFRVGKDYTDGTKDPVMALRVERLFQIKAL